MSVLETTRLRLRELTEADAAPLTRLYREPSVARFMGPSPASEDEERVNLRAHRANYYAQLGYGLWGVELRETGALVGRCGLLRSEIAGRIEVELSYLIAPDHQRRGLATEAASAALAYATGVLALPRIVAVIAPDNVASIRVAERLGLRYEGEVQYTTFGVVRLYATSCELPLVAAS